ncbi:MAG TPA: hypothetical protein VFQ45_11050 [Longimicrobium sp.]|nr:hypothetical protein [Longimicrobium sp.]
MNPSTRLAAALAAALALTPLCPSGGAAQDRSYFTARNAVYVEAGGNGGLISINLDRLITPNIGIRAGFATIVSPFGWATDEDASVTVVPITANALLGSGSSRAEIGAGVTILNGEIDSDLFDIHEEGTRTIPTATFGFRYQRPAGGPLFRIGLTPFFVDDELIGWAGVSFGYSF